MFAIRNYSVMCTLFLITRTLILILETFSFADHHDKRKSMSHNLIQIKPDVTRDAMNRLHAIDVFEEVKDNHLTGQEFCFKLYKSHVSIEPKLPRLAKPSNCENAGGSCPTPPPERVHAREVELRVANAQQLIIRVKTDRKHHISEACERHFKLKVNVKNENVRRKRWGNWREACHRSMLGMEDLVPTNTGQRTNKIKISGDIYRRPFSPSKDARIRQILQPMCEAWRRYIQGPGHELITNARINNNW